MIGLDTNVLVRYLTQDDLPQARAVDRLMDELVTQGERAFVGRIVLCELVWVLSGPYRFDKKTIVEVLEQILVTAQFEVDVKDLVDQALAEYRAGKGDFAAYLLGRDHRAAGCETTRTFDRKLATSTAFELLES